MEPGKTANIKMLKELRSRSFLASKMMYEQSTRYSNYAFWAVMVASGLVGVAAANLCDYLPVGAESDRWVSASKMLIGVFSGFAISFQTGKFFLTDYFEKKQQLYNETASGWQKLELDIALFLNSVESSSAKDISEFLSKCIKERSDVCNKSKPEEDIYKKYHNNPDLAIEKSQNKRSVIANIVQHFERIEEAEEDQEEGQENDDSLVCWACLPYGVYYCLLYRVAEVFIQHVTVNRCPYHREHFF